MLKSSRNRRSENNATAHCAAGDASVGPANLRPKLRPCKRLFIIHSSAAGLKRLMSLSLCVALSRHILSDNHQTNKSARKSKLLTALLIAAPLQNVLSDYIHKACKKHRQLFFCKRCPIKITINIIYVLCDCECALNSAIMLYKIVYFYEKWKCFPFICTT